MKTKTGLKSASALMITSALVACGGGNGESNGESHSAVTAQSVAEKYTGKTTFANLDTDNAGELAQRVYEQSQSFANNEDSFTVFENILGLSNSFDESPTMSGNCNTGSYHIKNNLTNGIGSLSVSLNNCQIPVNNESHTVNGNIMFNYTALDNNGEKNTYSTTFNNFEYKFSENSKTGTNLIYGYDKYEKVGEEYKYISNTLNTLTISIPHINQNTVEMTQNFTIIQSTDPIGQNEYRMSGDFYLGTEGKVSISTVTPLIFSTANEIQYGSFILTGENNSNVKVVVDNFATSLHVDEDGDGTYEYEDTSFYL